MNLNKIKISVERFTNDQNKIAEICIKKKLDNYLIAYSQALSRAEQSIMNQGAEKVIRQL